MNNEILKLAEECGAEVGVNWSKFHLPEELQAFYDKAFQSGRDSMQLGMSQQELVYQVWNTNDYPSHWEDVDEAEYNRCKCDDDKRIVYICSQPPQTNKEGE